MNEVSVAADEALSTVLAAAVDEFMADCHEGKRPSIDDYAGRYPAVAEQLRQVLPALAIAEPADVAGDEGDELPGTLGDFRVLREVGRGGMGVVYEADQISLCRHVALKVLPFAATMDARSLQRFQNEARAAASLHHEHIVPVYAVGSERGVHYYAMQFIDGQTVAELIERQRSGSSTSHSHEPTPAHAASHLASPEPVAASADTATGRAAPTESAPRDAAAFRQIAAWAIDAAEALEHAHSIGIVHRDVKPANLMIDAHGKLWVTDFGLARTAIDSGQTLTGDVLGTLRYSSPEQALAKHGLVDHRADLYSLGVTLYELLTGRPAVAGKDREEVLRRIAFEEPAAPRRFNPALPAELDIIVVKATAKEPGDRYATARELADDVQRFLDHRPIQARRPSLWQVGAKWTRRHQPVVWAAGLILLVTAVALGAVAAVSRHKEREAQKALEQARAQREFARRTVHDMYTQVAEKWLKNEPHLQPLQRRFLQKALAYYEQFAREEADDPEANREKALALRRVGEVEFKLGDRQAAEAPLREALALFEKLTKEAGNRPEDRHECVICLRALTGLLDALGEKAEVAQTVRRAVKLAETLALEFPGELDYRHSWAQCLAHEGGFLVTAGRRTEAEVVLKKARAELDRLVADSPDDASVRVTLVGTSLSHYVALMRQERSPDSEALLDKGLAHAEWLFARFAHDPEIRSTVAGVYRAYADLLSTTQREQAALAPYAKAADHEEWLADRYPDVPDYRYQVATTLLNMGQTCLDLRKLDDGERYVGRALVHFEKLWAAHSDHPIYVAVPLRELARAFNWLGQYLAEDRQLPRAEKALRQSIAFWRRLAGDFPMDAEQRHLVGGIHRQLGGVCVMGSRYADAVTEYRRALSLDESDWRILALLSEMLARAPVESVRNPPEAVTLALRAVALAPKEALPTMALGYAHHAAGEHEQARAALQDATKLGGVGDRAPVWLHLAKSCWHLGDQEQARRWYDKAAAWMDQHKAQDPLLRRYRAEAAALLGIRDGATSNKQGSASKD